MFFSIFLVDLTFVINILGINKYNVKLNLKRLDHACISSVCCNFRVLIEMMSVTITTEKSVKTFF